MGEEALVMKLIHKEKYQIGDNSQRYWQVVVGRRTKLISLSFPGPRGKLIC